MENMPSANGDKNTAAHRRSAPACVRLPILVTHTGNKRRIRATTCTNAQKQGWLIRQSFPLLLFQYFFIIRDRFILNFMFSQLKSSRVLQYRTAASRKCCSYCLRIENGSSRGQLILCYPVCSKPLHKFMFLFDMWECCTALYVSETQKEKKS